MRLLRQIIDKKLENVRTLDKASEFILSYQERISAYLLALSYLGLIDKLIKKKTSLWNKYVKTSDRKYYSKLSKYKPQEDYIILQAINKMDIIKEQQSESGNQLFNEFTWAILSFEHEEAE